MGAKGSKKSGGGGGKTAAAAPVKIVLPPKKVKKESPYDLTSYVFLGGVVIEEYVELEREVSNVALASKPKALEPPKPLADMTEDERKAWDAEVEKHEKKLQMQKLMEKNLQVKLQHGEKPIAPPVKGGVIGKAKKKMQQAQEKINAKAEEVTKPHETVEERVKRQAMAGAGGTLTGGATAQLGQDIAKSQAMRDLEKKRKEFAKQEEQRKKQEEEDRKKAEAEKKKNQPKGLSDFLSKVEGTETAANTASTSTPAKQADPASRLNAFLSSAEAATPVVVQTPTNVDQSVKSTAEPAEGVSAGGGGVNRLAAFLQTTETPQPQNDSPNSPAVTDETEAPKSESKISSFLGSAMRRLSLRQTPVAKAPEDENVPVVDKPTEDLVNNVEVSPEPTQDTPETTTEAAAPEPEAPKPDAEPPVDTEDAPSASTEEAKADEPVAAETNDQVAEPEAAVEAAKSDEAPVAEPAVETADES